MSKRPCLLVLFPEGRDSKLLLLSVAHTCLKKYSMEIQVMALSHSLETVKSKWTLSRTKNTCYHVFGQVVSLVSKVACVFVVYMS